VLVVRVYRQFYGIARTIGMSLGILIFALVGMSAGVYLTMTRFGQDRTMDKSAYYALRGPFLTMHPVAAPGTGAVRTDRRSIDRGRTLFLARCSACHDPESTQTKVGPGLKGLLRNPRLPKSGHPATAESIRFQLRQPLGAMPSFAYLSDEEMNDLIAYLNTL
jgi:mono/diheme cytochrome c family protein